jgi:hypothetical protein
MKRSWIVAGGTTVAAASLLFAFSAGAQAEKAPESGAKKPSAADEKSPDSTKKGGSGKSEAKGATQQSAGSVSFNCDPASYCESNHAQFPGGRLALDVEALPQGSNVRVMVFVNGEFVADTTKEDTEVPVSVYKDAPAGDLYIKAEKLRGGVDGPMRGGARWG